MNEAELKAKVVEAWTWFLLVGGHWVALSLAINLLLRWRKAEHWVAWAEGVPVLATTIRWVRALGVDPKAAIEAGATAAAAKAAATQAGRLTSGFFSDGTSSPPPALDASPPTPRDPSAAAPPAPPPTERGRRL